MDDSIDLKEVGPLAAEALLGRFSAWPLMEPAPSACELGTIFDLAVRAPDHGGLQPWRFVTIQGNARHAFADLLVEAARARNHDDPERFRKKASVAPLIIVPAVQLTPVDKVPEIEQWLSAGAAVMNVLNGLYLMGYGGFWATGPNAFDPRVRDALGFAANEHLLGFVYVGTPEARAEGKQRPDGAKFVRSWLGTGF